MIDSHEQRAAMKLYGFYWRGAQQKRLLSCKQFIKIMLSGTNKCTQLQILPHERRKDQENSDLPIICEARTIYISTTTVLYSTWHPVFHLPSSPDVALCDFLFLRLKQDPKTKHFANTKEVYALSRQP